MIDPSLMPNLHTDEYFFEDEVDDDLTIEQSISNPVHFNITPESGHIGLVGQASILEGRGTVTASSTASLTTEPKIGDQPVTEPPDILWSTFARMLMSPTRFQAEWLPHIADMHFEYSECMRRDKKWAAKWAVLRAHYYSVPFKVWAIAGVFLLWMWRHWIAG